MANLKKILKLVPWTLMLSALIFVSCQNNRVCDVSTSESSLFVKFHRFKKRTYQDTLHGTLYTDSFLTVGFKNFFIITKSQTYFFMDTTTLAAATDPALKLPVSPKDTMAQYVILADTNVRTIKQFLTPDTLTITYSKTLQLISQACGYTYYYNINTVSYTNHYFKLIPGGPGTPASAAVLPNSWRTASMSPLTTPPQIVLYLY